MCYGNILYNEAADRACIARLVSPSLYNQSWAAGRPGQRREDGEYTGTAAAAAARLPPSMLSGGPAFLAHLRNPRLMEAHSTAATLH